MPISHGERGGRAALVDFFDVGPTGDAVGREVEGPTAGRVVFARGGAPGDRCVVELSSERSGRAHGYVRAIVASTDARVAPPCPHAGTCGGCPFQHVDPRVVSALAANRIHRELSRISQRWGQGALPPVHWEASAPFGWRRRMRLAYRRVAGGVELGFRESGSHELVDIAECAVAVAPLRDRLPSLRAALAEHGGAGGEVLLLADSVGTCFASVRLRDGALVGALDRALFEAGFGGVRVESRAGAAVRGVERAMLAWQGPERSGLHPVPPHGFAQANEEVARRFAARIAALAADFSAGLGAPRRAFDLFCGAGALSIPLADAGLEVTAAESFAPSLALLRDFAAQNEWMRLRTSLVDLRDEAALRRALDDPDAGVVLDPPREGAAEVVAALARQKPPWVVYGSCDLATLARDLNELYRAGYRIRDVWGFDMFPHTGHVEVVAGLTRLELG